MLSATRQLLIISTQLLIYITFMKNSLESILGDGSLVWEEKGEACNTQQHTISEALGLLWESWQSTV